MMSLSDPKELALAITYEGAPQIDVIEHLVRTLFFASLATEEGTYQQLGLLYTPTLESLANPDSPWDVVVLRDPRRFTTFEIAKLGPATSLSENFLVVAGTLDRLEILGIATPHGRSYIFDEDRLLRLLAPAPGVLIATAGSHEVARYERGVVTPSSISFSPFRRGPYRRQLDSIRRAALPTIHEHSEYIDVVDQLQAIASRLAATDHGGLLAILSPGSDPGHECSDAKWLKTPLPLGKLLDDMYSLDVEMEYDESERLDPETGLDARPMTADEARVVRRNRATTAKVERLIEQVTRLLSLDGAVICSHSLEVVAFGAKLPVPDPGANVDVFDVVENQGVPSLGQKWRPGVRGSRHWAGAYFAHRHPDGIALIVSQDGQTAVFQRLDDKVVYWPVRLPYFEEFAW
jgi:hypothetical protein